jgi:hypothetical protein
MIRRQALEPDVKRLALQHRASLRPVEQDWLRQRLTLMGAAFGHERNPDRATAWLHETRRLLSDLPGDILDHAIDEAIKGSDRGFMPQVGQIRAIADPMRSDREREALRLEAIVNLIERGSRSPARSLADSDSGGQCTGEQAAAIMAEFGLSSEVPKSAPRGPLRRPGVEDYLALGLDLAVATRAVSGAGSPSGGP